MVYRGIPYAEKPVGDLRWRRPVLAKPWDGTQHAEHFAPPCMQAGSPRGTFYGEEFFRDADCLAGMDEDCLYLNIWVPEGTTPQDRLPVAFWIHGGAFSNGYAHEIEFDGAAWNARGVILVTAGYRLNVFGFFAYPALAAEDAEGVCGNYGLWDQLCALQWVRENIAAFGGDPARITLMGQSAGARSVQVLTCSEQARGQVCGAVIQSSYAGADPAMDPMPVAAYQRRGEDFLAFCGMETVAQLRTLSAAALFAAYQRFEAAGHGNFTLCTDGALVQGSLAQHVLEGRHHAIPYLIGTTAHEGERIWGEGAQTGLQWQRRSEAWARAHALHMDTPCFLYRFLRELPGDRAGAFHSAELWYMFGTLSRSWRPFTANDHLLSERMLDYWTAFAISGDPNGKGHPVWAPAAVCPTALPLDA